MAVILSPRILFISVFALALLFSCSSAPRYGSSAPKSPPKKNTAKTAKTKQRQASPKLIPVEKKPSLSYQRQWTGVASWYGKDFHGKKTANGEIYNMHDLTAAHRTLPLGTVVRVTNLDNGKSVQVRINDRGPYIHGRLIDLSYAAAKKLDFTQHGTAHVRLQVITFGDNSYKKD
jgi:rare lipoprotein A